MNKFTFPKDEDTIYMYNLLKFIWWTMTYTIFLAVIFSTPVGERLNLASETNIIMYWGFAFWIFSPFAYGIYNYIKFCGGLNK